MKEESFTPKKLLVILVEVILIVMLALMTVGLIRMYWIGAIGVTGSSMSPTIHSEGDKVYINKAFKNLEIDDVVVLYVPLDLGSYDENGRMITVDNYADDKQSCPASRTKTMTDFIHSLPFGKTQQAGDVAEDDKYKCIIKRIVACPGDTVAFVNGELYVNNVKERTYEYTWTSLGVTGHADDNYTVVLGEDQYFVLGDNRANSLDSEDYGPVKRSWILGKVFLLNSDGKWKTSI